jgi:hypothetical protein
MLKLEAGLEQQSYEHVPLRDGRLHIFDINRVRRSECVSTRTGLTPLMAYFRSLYDMHMHCYVPQAKACAEALSCSEWRVEHASM